MRKCQKKFAACICIYKRVYAKTWQGGDIVPPPHQIGLSAFPLIMRASFFYLVLLILGNFKKTKLNWKDPLCNESIWPTMIFWGYWGPRRPQNSQKPPMSHNEFGYLIRLGAWERLYFDKFVLLQVSQPDNSAPVKNAVGYRGKTQLKSPLWGIMTVMILNVGILEPSRRKDILKREIES